MRPRPIAAAVGPAPYHPTSAASADRGGLVTQTIDLTIARKPQSEILALRMSQLAHNDALDALRILIDPLQRGDA